MTNNLVRDCIPIEQNEQTTNFKRRSFRQEGHFVSISEISFLLPECYPWEGTNETRNMDGNLPTLKKLARRLRSLFSLEVLKLLLTILRLSLFAIILLPCSPYLVFAFVCEKESGESDLSPGDNDRESGDNLSENVRESSIERSTEPTWSGMKINFRFLLDCLHPYYYLVIFRNLLMLLFVPLLLIYFWFSFYPVVFSSLEKLAIFGLLALCNCFFYLSESNKKAFFKMPSY